MSKSSAIVAFACAVIVALGAAAAAYFLWLKPKQADKATNIALASHIASEGQVKGGALGTTKVPVPATDANIQSAAKTISTIGPSKVAAQFEAAATNNNAAAYWCQLYANKLGKDGALAMTGTGASAVADVSSCPAAPAPASGVFGVSGAVPPRTANMPLQPVNRLAAQMGLADPGTGGQAMPLVEFGESKPALNPLLMPGVQSRANRIARWSAHNQRRAVAGAMMSDEPDPDPVTNTVVSKESLAAMIGGLRQTDVQMDRSTYNSRIMGPGGSDAVMSLRGTPSHEALARMHAQKPLGPGMPDTIQRQSYTGIHYTGPLTM